MNNLKTEWISREIGYVIYSDDTYENEKMINENDSHLRLSEKEYLEFLVDYVRLFIEKTH